MDWPPGKLYHSPLGVYPFQLDGITDVYFKRSAVAVWDTGTGKSHLAMVISSFLFEDDEVDLVFVVAERNKITEWAADFEQYTKLKPHVHHGAGRDKRLEKALAAEQPAQVLITTYETARSDCAQFVKTPGRRGTSVQPNWLLDILLQRRLAVIYDESTKIGNRSAQTYKAHDMLLSRLRRNQPDLRVVGLTATPYESGWERSFNSFRLISPDRMPTIGDFNREYIRARDQYGRALYHQHKMGEFAATCGSIINRKRKTDPDIMAQFPKMTEEFRRIQLPRAQQDFYDFCAGLQDGKEEPVAGLWTVLRQVAGHPQALLRSQGDLATLLVDEMGSQAISALPSGKTAALLEHLDPLVNGQGAKVVVFTFFGQSVLPVLGAELRKNGFPTFEHHGQLSVAEADRVKNQFRSCSEPAIFLTSDAGSRGLNLPQASYVVEYESALTYANRVQRINRIHRIDSEFPSTTSMTFIAEGTVEDGVARLMSSRNRDHDTLLDDTDDGSGSFISAAERRAMMAISRRH